MRDGARAQACFRAIYGSYRMEEARPTPIECARTQKILVLRLGQKRFPMNLRTRAITKYLLSLSTVALVFTSMTWADDDDKGQSDISKRIVDRLRSSTKSWQLLIKRFRTRSWTMPSA